VLVRNGNGKLCDGLIRERTCSICTYKTLYHIPSILSVPLASLSILSKNLGITKNLMEGKVTSLLMIPSSIQLIKDVLKELVDNLDQFVTYTKWYEKILLENGVPQNKVTVVPTAAITVKKNEQIKILNPAGLPVKIIFIGRIQPQKGIHLIIEAMRHFLLEQVRIDLYGKKEDSDYYKKCINESLHLKNIIWKGTIPTHKVSETISAYDILCLPSTFSEMSSLVVQEAFSAGVPILASKVYGNMEQVKHNLNGLLFEVNSAEDLKDKIKALVDNPQLLQELKNNVKPPISFDIVNESYLRLYESLHKN
jgi:glycosyltransferase involved in cell wall biosynthesis